MIAVASERPIYSARNRSLEFIVASTSISLVDISSLGGGGGGGDGFTPVLLCSEYHILLLCAVASISIIGLR